MNYIFKIFIFLAIITGFIAMPESALAALPAVTTEGPTGFIPGEPGSCYTYLTDYLFPGPNNDQSQVIRLQQFLNQVSGSNAFTGTLLPANLPVTGYYGPLTTQAVKNFQRYYWPVILLPWQPHGLMDVKTGTGLVYKTTKRWINMLNCPGAALALPDLRNQ